MSRRPRRLPVDVLLVFAVALTLTLGMLVVATQFRPISDDYIHIGRVIELGVVGSTADWFITLLPGIPGVFLMSSFAWWASEAPWGAAYVPYVALVCSVLYLLGVVVLWPLVQAGRRWVAWMLAAAFPPLWLLSIGNLFPQHDVINAYGMLGWFSAGYRVHLPVLIVTFFFLINCWKGGVRSGLLVGFLGGFLLAMSFLNVLPDMIAYLLIAAGTAGYLAWQACSERASQWSPGVLINLTFAFGIAGGLAALFVSPGTAARTERHPLQFTWESAPSTALYQLTVFLREMMNISNGLVLIAAVSLGLYLAVRQSPAQRLLVQRTMGLRAVQAVALTVLLIGSGVVGETLTYGAVFHRWAVLQVEFIAIMLVGLLIGQRLARRFTPESTRIAAPLVTIAILTVALVPLLNVAQLAIDRRETWETGEAAPVSFLEDREQAGLREWWAVIDTYRRGG